MENSPSFVVWYARMCARRYWRNTMNWAAADQHTSTTDKMWTVQRKVLCVLWLAKFECVTIAQWKYRCVYNEAPPHRNNINRWDKQLQDTGSLSDKHSSGGSSVSDETVKDIRESYLNSPKNLCLHVWNLDSFYFFIGEDFTFLWPVISTPWLYGHTVHTYEVISYFDNILIK